MLTSLALIFLVGLAMAAICQRLKLPRIIGMLLTGILLGPYALNWLDESILGISSQLRQIALIIILIKAGLSLNLVDLKKVGRPAVMMACVPASFEILAYVPVCPCNSWCFESRGSCYGGCIRSRISCSGRAAYGTAYGDSIWHEEEYSPDDSGGGIL